MADGVVDCGEYSRVGRLRYFAEACPFQVLGFAVFRVLRGWWRIDAWRIF
jgi:hypothetical protein